MKIKKLSKLIFKYVEEYNAENDFQKAVEELKYKIDNLEIEKFLSLITEIGTIPENINHDSKEEKLFTKVAELILARCFNELNLKSNVYTTRGNTADVFAESKCHNYSLVADAKTFRLSRTAKNQKDFKVESLNFWRHDNDYAVLCCPYFQYPRKKSAIYKQALDYNVALFSWEYFSFLINHNVKEDFNTNLSMLWNFSKIQSSNITVDKSDLCFLNQQNIFLSTRLNFSIQELKTELEDFKSDTLLRCKSEINYFENKISEVKNYSREEAITILLKSLKLKEKIKSIYKFMKDLKRNESE